MGIWDTIRRHCGFSSSNQGQNKQGRKGKLVDLKPRNHMIEQCEDRVLLSVSPSTVMDGSFTEYLIQQARESAGNLANYDSSELDSVTKWVVGFNDSASSNANAAYRYGANSLGKSGLSDNAYVWQFSSNTSWTTAAEYLQSATGVDYFYPVVSSKIRPMSIDSEPYAQYQYYLYNNDFNYSNINVEGAWQSYTGEGIVVGVVDQGVDPNHVDLISNLDADKSYDFVDYDTDFSPASPEGHGTCVSGIIGAEGDNKTGVTGIAYDSTLYSFRILSEEGSASNVGTAEALVAQLDTTDVYNNSWGYYLNSYGYFAGKVPVQADVLNSLATGVTEGRDGQGAIYVFSAGNEGESGGDVNDEFLTASRYTITVGSLAYNGTICSYSNTGANVLVVAPGTLRDAVTTDITGADGYNTVSGDDNQFVEGFSDDYLDYTSSFNGTSAAAPMVSGTVALMLEANPNLTWRDVQHILVETSSKVDAKDVSWFSNAAGYKVSSTYGFGLVDATAAVTMAESWTNVAEEAEKNVKFTANSSIGSSASSVGTIVDSKISALETVELTMNLSSANVNNMKIELISPSGTVSVLQEAKSNSNSDATFDDSFLFSSVQFWGEAADGNWELRISDGNGTKIGVLTDWTLSLHGTFSESVGPNVVAVFPDADPFMEEGDTLNVAPTEMTVRFTEGQRINASSLQGSVVLYYRPDGASEDHWEEVEIGYIGLGNQLNEIVIRPASTFLDGDYRLFIRGQADAYDPTSPVLKNTSGRALGYTEETPDGSNYNLSFTLELATQVSTVVPQPIEDGAILTDTVDVYFDGQDINFKDNAVAYLNYFNLVYTNDTADTTDDNTVRPVSLTATQMKTVDGVEVDSDAEEPEGSIVRFFTKVRLTFAAGLDTYGTGAFRLNVGTELKSLLTTQLGDEVAGADAAETFAGAPTLADNANNIFANGGSYVINGRINSSDIYYTNRWPGGNDEVGHKLQITSTAGLQGEQHIANWDYDLYDAEAGLKVYAYCFPKTSGAFPNLITDQQKDAVRQIFQLLEDYSGIQIYEVETPADGGIIGAGAISGMLQELDPNITLMGMTNFYVGDLGILGGVSGPGAVGGLGSVGNSTRTDQDLFVVLDSADYGESIDCSYNSGFFHTAMHEILHNLGLGHTYDLENPGVMGSNGDSAYYQTSAENAYPAPADVIHLQYLYRLDSNDIDMYKFTIPQGSDGKINIETIAERMSVSSSLDTLLHLYNAKGELVATNDNYFGVDSLISVNLTAGDYFIGVTAAGNDDYDPTIENSGLNGTTDGAYQLKVDFVPNETQGIKDTSGLMIDGDNDGYAGGDFNFWFDVQTAENTIIVDKTGASYSGADYVYKDLDDALAKAKELADTARHALSSDPLYNPSQRVNVRVVGNNLDKAIKEQEAYEIGIYNGTTLRDGADGAVPMGVNLSFENGAVVKLYGANITAGSTKTILTTTGEPVSDAEGSLQVLGIPGLNVTFTSYANELIGKDYLPNQTKPQSGDWGGLVFTNKYENDFNESASGKQFGGVTVLEDEGVFLNYVAFADISYAGGEVNVNGKRQSYAGIYIDEARPMVMNNVISASATAAISADPNSFEESEYYGTEGANLYTADYTRIGPEFQGNRFVKTVVYSEQNASGELVEHKDTYTNNINGVFVRTVTPDTQETIRVTTAARFNDTDIPHVIQENLHIAGSAGGAIIGLRATDNAITDVTARESGSLVIDNRMVVKIANARIELENGGTLLAEGENGKSIVFTSVYDDSYGNGGTFDTSNNKSDIQANAGDWSGIYLNPSSKASLEYVKFMDAGGERATKDGAAFFAPIEVTQAQIRVANSYFANNNAEAFTENNRVGRGTIANGDQAVIYVRNAQPIIVSNTFQDNSGAIMSINANGMTADSVVDSGRQTGLVQPLGSSAATADTFESGYYAEYSDNSGPMVRANTFAGNTYNGLIVRGEILSTESVWDDTDIVHILFDTVTTANQHTYGGLRLQSSATSSLVVKLQGADAGFVASGSPSDIEDRIGGTVQIIGNGPNPVILTSINDSTVGAGYDPWGNPQTKTNNRNSIGSSGDWKGIEIRGYSNDYNAATVLENESTLFSETGDKNGTISSAQYIGKLADNLYSGDENLRLGFEIHGTIQSDSRADADIYSFDATAGTELWVDVDLSRYALDTVVEILDANGNVIAKSDNSEQLTSWLAYQNMYDDEIANLASLKNMTVAQYRRYYNGCNDSERAAIDQKIENSIIEILNDQVMLTYGSLVGQRVPLGFFRSLCSNSTQFASKSYNFDTQFPGNADRADTDSVLVTPAMQNWFVRVQYLNAKNSVYASSMAKDIWNRESLDDYGINEKDSGFRVTLPGAEGVQTMYYLRVSSAIDESNAFAAYKGQTYGDYQVQIRLQEAQIKPGSTVQNAQIYYAVDGISVVNMPSSSPLTVDTADVEIRVNGWGSVVSTTGLATTDADGNTVAVPGSSNNTFETAQPIGNVLSADNCAITVTGYTNDATDIDWYRFDVALGGVQAIPGVVDNTDAMVPLVLDIDYADNVGRPDLDIWLFDANGNLVASSRTTTNISDDSATPMAGGDTANLEAGSNGNNDGYIGTFYVPSGSYFVAIAPHGLYPATVLADSFHSEPIDSISRVVEDNCTDVPGQNNSVFSGITVPQAVALNFRPESYSLADARMYIMSSSTLDSVYALTGGRETNWTDNEDIVGKGYSDANMRSDGLFYAIDNVNRTMDVISLENAQVQTSSTAIGITSYFWNGEAYVTPENDIRYTAFEFANDVAGDRTYGNVAVTGYASPNANARYLHPMVAIGQIDTGDYQTNLLYLLNDDGTVHSLTGDATSAAAKVGTNAVPLAQLNTALTLVTTDATDVEGRLEAEDEDLRDGTRLTLNVVRYTDDDVPTTMDIIMELDTGVDLQMTPNGMLSFRDGDTFTIVDSEGNDVVFEFDSGPVLNVDVAQMKALTAAAGPDGISFTVRGVTTKGAVVTSTVSLIAAAPVDDEGKPAEVPDGTIALDAYEDTASMRLAADIINLLQEGLKETTVSVIAGWNDVNGNMFHEDDENARISFAGATGAQFNALQPLVEGEFGLVDDTHVAIEFNEWTADETILGVNHAMEDFIATIAEAINRNVLGVTATYAHREITLDNNGNRVLSLGDRLCISGLESANIDLSGLTGFNNSNGTAIELLGNRHNVVDDSLSSDGTVTQPTANQVVIPIKIAADTTATSFAQIIANSVQNYFLQVGDAYGFTLYAATVGKDLAFSGIELVEAEVDAPLEFRGEQGMRNGGDITGLAWVGDKLYCVTGNGVTGNGGDLYEVQFTRGTPGVDNADFANFDMAAATSGYKDTLVRIPGAEIFIPTWDTLLDTDWDIIYEEVPRGDTTILRLCENEVDGRINHFSLRYVGTMRDEAGNAINFSGLSNGPDNVEDGLYSGLLFGTGANGVVYCFNENGVFQTVFTDEQTSVNTGIAHPIGIDFSVQDYNMWRRVQTVGTQSPETLDLTRPAPTSEVTAGLTSSENSYYFGIEDPHDENRYVANGEVSTATLMKYVTNSDLYYTYNAAGGTTGSMISSEFSLLNVSATDSPYLYFDYMMETENSNMFDSFKIYIRTTNPSASVLGETTGNELGSLYSMYDNYETGQWALVAGNVDGGFNTSAPYTLRETGDGWIQARIDLSAFVGMSNLQMKLEFSTAGGNYVGQEDSVGSLLYGTEATDLYPGDRFVIGDGDNQTEFVFNLTERLEALSSPYYRLTDANPTQALVFRNIEDGTEETIEVSRNNTTGIRVTQTTTANDLAAALVERLGDRAIQNGNSIGLIGVELVNEDNPLLALQGTDRYNVSDINLGAILRRFSAPAFEVTNNLGQTKTYSLNDNTLAELELMNAGRTQDVMYDLPLDDMDYDADVDEKDFALMFTTLFEQNPLDGVSVYALENGSLVFQGASNIVARDLINQFNNPIVQEASIRKASDVVTTGLTVANNPAFAIAADQTLQFQNRNGSTFNVTVSENPASNADIVITYTTTPAQVAASLLNLINNRANAGFYSIQNDTMLVLDGVTLLTATDLLIETKLGNVELVDITYADSAEEVADAIAVSMDAHYSTYDAANPDLDPNNPDALHPTSVVTNPRTGETIHTAAKINSGAEYQVHVIGKELLSSGPLSGANMQYGDSRIAVQNPEVDNDIRLDSMGAGQNNAFGGVYVDNFIIGYAEHGETHAGSTGDTTFAGAVPDGAVESGYYQFNVRTGTDFGVYDSQGKTTTLYRTFYTNDRLDGGLSIATPQGQYINHLDFFTVGDGDSEQKFVMVNSDIAALEEGSTEAWVTARIADQTIRSTDWLIYYAGDESASQIADQVVSAINTKYLSTYENGTSSAFEVRASNSGTSNRVDLYGATWVKGLNQGRNALGVTEMCYINYNSENWNYQDYVSGVMIMMFDPTDTGQSKGDTNVIQTQGQIILSGNLIAYSENNGVQVYNEYTADESDQNVNAAFATINTNRTVPSVVVMNSILAYNEHYGVVYAGSLNNETDADGNLLVTTSVPYGRVINNTIWGDDRSGSSIGVGLLSNSSVTMMNNVVANTDIGIYVDNTLDAENTSLINMYTTYCGNTYNTFGGARMGTNSFQLSTTDPLFVDPSRGKLNFYPAQGSKIIDSSINVQEQRSDMEKVYNLLGISVSGLYAPEVDIYDQARADDPSTQSYAGTGSNAFKDRGAVERVDWTGPVATLVNPMDKTAADKIKDESSNEKVPTTADRDYKSGDVFVAGTVLDKFNIQLSDNGVGIDDDTVTADKVLIFRNKSEFDSVIIDARQQYEDENPNVELMELGKDYLFKYDTTKDLIMLIPVKGSWDMGYTYHIEILENSLFDLAGNVLQFNRPNVSSDPLVDRTIFKVRVSGLNFGDAPEKYPTLMVDDGAAHVLSSGFMLGRSAASTSEAPVSPNADKSLDDDGVLFSSVDNLLMWGVMNTLDIVVSNASPVLEKAADGSVTNSIYGEIGVWIDMNADGDWEDDGEFFSYVISTANGATIDGDAATQTIAIAMPAKAAGVDATFMRVRLFTPGNVPTAAMFKGTVDGGEVEDYKVNIVDDFQDFGDAPEAYGEAYHIVSDEYYMGKSVDAELAAKRSPKADGDDLASSNGVNDEDGIVFDKISMTPGSYGKFTATTSKAGYLYIWVDANQDGLFTEDELLYSGSVGAMDGEELTFQKAIPGNPNSTQNYSTFARARFSETALTASASVTETVGENTVTYDGRSVGSGMANGQAVKGEVEDYRVLVSTTFFDYGDAPDSYKTLVSSDGPIHEFNVSTGSVSSAYLGAAISPDDDGRPSVAADLDEGDDGLSFNGLFLVPGQSVVLPITVHGSGYLSMWLDSDNDGEFTDADMVEILAIDGSPRALADSALGWYLDSGDHRLTIKIDADAVVSQTYLRVRYYDESVLDGGVVLAASAYGFGGLGEVEDYAVDIVRGDGIIEGYKFQDLNKNGVWDRSPLNESITVRCESPNTIKSTAALQTNVEIGFEFEFFGKTYTSLDISRNGFIQFGANGSTAANGLKLASSKANFDGLILAPFWTTINQANVSYLPNNPVTYTGVSASGNKYFQVDWEGALGPNGASNTFTLYIENSSMGDIVSFIYKTDEGIRRSMGWSDANTFIGILGGAGEGYAFHSQGSATLYETLNTVKSYSFRMNPNSGQLGGVDYGIQGVPVYIDKDGNGLWGQEETVVFTDSTGAYRFEGLQPGEYIVREIASATDIEANYYDSFVEMYPEANILDNYVSGNSGSVTNNWMQTSPNRFTGPSDSETPMQIQLNFGEDSGTDQMPEGNSLVFSLPNEVVVMVSIVNDLNVHTGSDAAIVDPDPDTESSTTYCTVTAYYNNTLSTQVRDLTQALSTAINSAYQLATGSKDNVAAVNKRDKTILEITGLFDMRVVDEKGNQSVPTGDNGWFDIASTYTQYQVSNSVADTLSGWYVVQLGSENEISGINFGNYRKPEVSIVDTSILEQSKGTWYQIEIPIEIRTSFGSTVTVEYQTVNGSATGYNAGSNVGNTLSPEVIIAAQEAGADYIHASGSYTFNNTPCETPMEEWEITQITGTLYSDSSYKLNDYEIKMAGNYIAYVEGVNGQNTIFVRDLNKLSETEPVWVSSNDDYADFYNDIAVTSKGEVLLVWSKLVDTENNKYELWYKFIEGGSSSDNEDGYRLNVGNDDYSYISPVVGDDCIYFIRKDPNLPASDANSYTLCVLDDLTALRSNLDSATPYVKTVSENSKTWIVPNSIDVDGDNAVWVEASSEANFNNSIGRIYYRNGETGAVTAISSSEARCSNPVIEGDYIVWEQNDINTSKNSIYMFDLADTGEGVVCISQSQYTDANGKTGYLNQSNPDISGDRIVWEGGVFDAASGKVTSEIYMYTISAKTFEIVSVGDGGCSDPSINGETIAWTQIDLEDENFSYIWSLDLSTASSAKNVSHNSAVQTTLDWKPLVTDEGSILWRGSRQISQSYDIFLAKRAEAVIRETIKVWVWGDTIVEPDEFFKLLISATGDKDTVITQNEAIVWILNDDSTNSKGMDFGSADPARYPTAAEDNGPRHDYSDKEYRLGQHKITYENITYHDLAKNSDSLDGQESNDGVKTEKGNVFGSEPLYLGAASNAVITVSTPKRVDGGYEDCYIDAWVDFNGNGVFDAEERIADSLFVAGGDVSTKTVDLAFLVPQTYVPITNTFARFRVSKEGGLEATGFAATGEVEDYRIGSIAKRTTTEDTAFEISGDRMDEQYTMSMNVDENGKFESISLFKTAFDAEADKTRYYYADVQGSEIVFVEEFRVDEEYYSRVLDLSQLGAVKFLTLNGAGGNDTIKFTGVNDSEIFNLYENEAFIYSKGLCISLENFADISIDAQGGNDTIKFYGSNKLDTFTCVSGLTDAENSASYANGKTYSNKVENFDDTALIYAFGNVNHGDTATVETIGGMDTTAEFNRNDLTMSTADKTIVRKLSGFASLEAISVNGARDTVLMMVYGDIKVNDQKEIAINGDGYRNIAKDFGYANYTAGDPWASLELVGSESGDLEISPFALSFSGTGSRMTATGFANMTFDAAGYAVSGKMNDSEGDDQLSMSSDEVQMKGINYLNIVKNMKLVSAYSTAGGADTAYLYDSDGDDYLYGQANTTAIYDQGKTYYNSVSGFANVVASSGSGSDTAFMYDSAGNDILTSTASYTQMSGSSYNNLVKGFGTVSAYSVNGGKDSATLYDSLLDDVLDAGDNWAQIASDSASQVRRVTDFANVNAVATNSGSKTATGNVNAVDFLFASGWKEEN